MNEWSQILDMMYVEMFPVPPQRFMFLYAKLNVQMNLLIMLGLWASKNILKLQKVLLCGMFIQKWSLVPKKYI